jgi:DNA (cytosine-5)-methyltransferase 1
VRSDGLAYTLEARTTAQAVCATGNRPHALTAEGHDASGDGTGRGTPVVAFHNRQDPDVSGDVTHPLGAQDNGLGVWLPWAVRRLMPVECERLQGFPDNHTLIPYGVSKKIAADELAFLRSLSHEEMAGVFGVDPDTMPPVSDEELRRLAADGPRYKALGNSMAVPCMGWILERLAESAGWATLQEAAE